MSLFLRCKAEFLALLLQSSMSHDAPEITLIWWFETFLIINVKQLCCSILFCGNCDSLFSELFWWIDSLRVLKREFLYHYKCLFFIHLMHLCWIKVLIRKKMYCPQTFECSSLYEKLYFELWNIINKICPPWNNIQQSVMHYKKGKCIKKVNMVQLDFILRIIQNL